jgi:ABC-type Fe3+ transport system permease subunit
LGFPFLIKLSWDSELEKYFKQFEISETLGVSSWSWLKNILWPQLIPKICDLAFLQSVWISGDFAMYKLIVNQDKTVASYMSTLMSTYRMDAAMVCGGFVILIIGFNFIFWMGVKKICLKL